MRSVLIVETDADTRTTLEEMLSSEGYSPVGVEAVEQAIEYLSAHEPPCMVLLDVGLPPKNGIGLLRWLKEQEGLREVPIAVMSGWRPADHGLADFRDRILRVVQKPFELDAVMKMIEEHCRPAPPA
jgi:DNA-binding NtrC family response regulator